MSDQSTLPAWVKPYLFVKFQDFGRGPAYDCWGWVRWVLGEVKGWDLPSLVTESSDPELGTLSSARMSALIGREAAKHWYRVERAQTFDIPWFVMAGGRMHVGLMINDEWFAHIEDEVGVNFEPISEPAQGRKLVGVYRHV